MKTKLITLMILLGFATISALQLNSCKVSEEILGKVGAQLWAENCNRCHNTPSPVKFTDNQWNVIGTHMRVRANLTAQEADKIMEFLKMAN